MNNVMIVDDSRVMRQLVRRSIRQGGYKPKTVLEAESGADALRQLRGGAAPDLVLSDWNMPEMNGIDLLRAMKEEEIDIPLGFVTSESTPEMRATAIGAGAVFLLTKPFTSADVRHALEAAGFKPLGKLRDASRVSIGGESFGSELITKLLDHLVNQKIMTRPGPRFPASVTPGLTCTWVDDGNQVLYAGVCEMSLAAALGAAIGLRPPSAVADLVRTGSIPEGLRADCREVFNVLSRAFTDAGSVHVRLLDISFAPDAMIDDVTRLNANAPGRMDFKITVGKHGSGRLAFCSTSTGFIHYAPTTVEAGA